jgi:PPM family protein phosphatase
MKFALYQDSVIGGRSINQDRMGYSFTKDALLLVVADGMGGHVKGICTRNRRLPILFRF